MFVDWHGSSNKSRWESSNKLKVAISFNHYFTVQSWNSALSEDLTNEIKNWDIVYCKSKIDVYRHVPDADICLLFGLGEYLMKLLKTPKLIYFPVLGLDFIKNRSIPKMITIEQPPPFSAQSIAEYCLAMSILLTRNLQNSFNNRFSKKWNQSNIIPQSIVSITLCKIGVLGLGRVGKEIARYFRSIGCEVNGCDIVKPSTNDVCSAFYLSDQLYEFIDDTDILIVALPLNESTKHMINKSILKALGSKKYLINVSRGEIIDEVALIDALSTNTIKGAALDVFETEPLSSNSGLYKCDNAIITPHISGNMNLFVKEIQQDFISKALLYEKNV
jgi:phosphoglycerate dehydrogenase-like enzyme